MSDIQCSRCKAQFVDEDWPAGKVQLYLPFRIWICAECREEIMDAFVEEKFA